MFTIGSASRLFCEMRRLIVGMTKKDKQFLYLTTTGHKSGAPHEIEIWFVPHEWQILSGRGTAGERPLGAEHPA